MAIKHTTQATGTNDPSKQVSKDVWNEDHLVEDGTFTIAKTAGLQEALNAKQSNYQSVPYSSTIDLSGGKKYAPAQQVTGAITPVPSSTLVVGSEYYQAYFANGTNIPNLSAFKELSGSSPYDNTPNVGNLIWFTAVPSPYDPNVVLPAYAINQFVGDVGQYNFTNSTPSLPVNTVAPVLSAVTVGGALSSTNGTWTGNPTPTYTQQFKLDGVNIASNYTVVSGDVGKVVTCVVTATNSQGSANATSNSQTVTSGDVTVPTLTSATVENATPTTLTLVFSEALDQTKTLSAADFTLSGGKTDSSPVYVNATTVSMTVTAFTNGESITLDVAAGAVRDVAGNNIAAITARAVTNNVAGAGDADADAFISAAGISDSTQQSAIQTLVTSLKANSLWTKMQAIYPMVGGTATTHKFNLKDPQDLNASFRLSFAGTLTHSASGVQGDGTTGYADTFFSPSSNFASASSSHVSFYQLELDTAGTSNCKMGAATNTSLGNSTYIAWHGSGSTLSSGIGALGATQSQVGGWTTTATRGHYIATRNGNTTNVMYLNGSAHGTTGTSTGSMATVSLNLFAQNNPSTRNIFSNKTCAFATIGTGLSATDAANLYSAIQAFQTTLGRQV